MIVKGTRLTLWSVCGAFALLSLPAELAQGQTAPTEAPTQVLPAVPSTPDEEATGGDDETPPVVYSEVTVSRYLTVDLVVQNAPITEVLRKLAVQSRKNIVPSGSLTQRVSATVYGASFYEGLEALLHANGLGYIERGEFIYVYTAEEIRGLREQERTRDRRVINLDYLRASDAKTIAQHLLSENGQLETVEDIAAESAGGGSEDFTSLSSAVEGIYTPGQDEFPVLNAIVIIDYPEHADEIEDLLFQLDTRPAQILIESTILQMTINEKNAFGVDFAVLGDVQFTDFFNFPPSFNPIDFQSTGPEADTPPTARNEDFVVANPGNTGLGDATVRGGIVFGDVGIFIRALDEVSDVTLLSNPKVMALNRQRAKVLVGTRVGFLETTVVENQVLQTVQFIDTGIEIDVRPYLMRDEKIRMELAPKVSSVVFRSVEGATGITQQVPDENIQTVATDVLIPQGHTAVIGGLFREDTSRSRSQVPVLGDIPLLGGAFRGHDDELDQVELIFLIKPTVMQDRVIVERGEISNEYIDHVRVGTREGMLPWSRERQTSQLNVRAERLLAEGRIDDALWTIRRSLELSPVQPEAVRIRERLVAQPTLWPTSSILEQVIEESHRALEEMDSE